MPQNSRPLSQAQIASIRQWIQEGARNDNAVGPCFDLRLSSVPAASGKPIQVRSRITASALTILSVRDPQSGRELLVEEGSVKSPKEAGDIAATGEWFSRTLTGEQGWPSAVSVEIRIQYASATPAGSVLEAAGQSTSNLLRSNCRSALTLPFRVYRARLLSSAVRKGRGSLPSRPWHANLSAPSCASWEGSSSA